MDIRTKDLEKTVDGRIIEDHDVIDTCKRSDHYCPVCFTLQRSTLTFQHVNRAVAVDSDNEEISQGPGTLEIADMAHMDKIKTAVGQDHLGAVRVHFGEQARKVSKVLNLV